MPCDYKKYPKDWKSIRERILRRDGYRCKFCDAQQGEPHWKTNSKVVLTVCHKNGDITDNRDVNLAAVCQRCHNILDMGERIKHRQKKLLDKQGIVKQEEFDI